MLRDIQNFLTNLFELMASDVAFAGIVVGVLLGGYLLLSFFIGRIYSKASISAVSAFVPIWNVVNFVRLGGYSPLWLVGYAASVVYLAGLYILPPLSRVDGNQWMLEPLRLFRNVSAFGQPLAIFLMIATGLIIVLSAYNIGRAFEKDAGYLLLFLFAFPAWAAALAFTGYDWDESEANPRSIGETDMRAISKAAREELEKNKMRAEAFINPTAPKSVFPEEQYESDYDRAVAEMERQRQRELTNKPKKSKKNRNDPGEAKIVDAGSYENIDPDFM